MNLLSSPSPEPKECSCWSCLKSCCCSDYSQPIYWTGAGVGVTGTVIGGLSGNVPLTVVSAIAATTNATAASRLSCLRDTIELGHSADLITHTVEDLRSANRAQTDEIQRLQESALKLHSDLESLQKERDEIRQQQETYQKKIVELTQSLDALQKRYASVSEACSSIQRTLSSSESEHAHAETIAATEIHADEERFAESLPLLAKCVAELHTSAIQARQENERLQKLLEDLKHEEADLQSQIVQIQKEKAALERLVKAEESEADVQRRIREGTDQLALVEARLKDMLLQLQELMSPTTT